MKRLRLLICIVLLIVLVPAPAALAGDEPDFEAQAGSQYCHLHGDWSWVNLDGPGWTLIRTGQAFCVGLIGNMTLGVYIQKPNGTYTSSNVKACNECFQRQIQTKESGINSGGERVITAIASFTLLQGTWTGVAPGCVGAGTRTAVCTTSRHVFAPNN